VKIYLDTCCYCRPFDEPEQEKISNERNVIGAILDLSPIMNYVIVGSLAIRTEIDEINDTEKHLAVTNFYKSAVNEYIQLTGSIIEQGRTMSQMAGLGGFDGLHLAFAEAAGADYLLTVDNKFEKASGKLNLKVKVINPLKFWGV